MIILKKQRIFVNTRYCWQHYNNTSLLSASLSNFGILIQIQKKNCGTLKFIQWHPSGKILEPLVYRISLATRQSTTAGVPTIPYYHGSHKGPQMYCNVLLCNANIRL
jgi:hypothetical protein